MDIGARDHDVNYPQTRRERARACEEIENGRRRIAGT